MVGGGGSYSHFFRYRLIPSLIIHNSFANNPLFVGPGTYRLKKARFFKSWLPEVKCGLKLPQELLDSNTCEVMLFRGFLEWLNPFLPSSSGFE